MSKYQDNAKCYHEEIRRILLREWDPIGVADVAEAQDEYDGYVGQIHGLLIRHEPKQKIVEFLWWVETEHMGLCGNRVHTEHVADRLLQLREEISGKCER
ncbi:MAG: hypothetical protein JW959_13580 [Pirellulales bacterium]|nr:hypothetical protein [Pirellulales bacterium]